MATPTEKIEETRRLLEVTITRVGTVETECELCYELIESLRRSDEETRLKLALVERELEHLKKSRELWGQRFWGLVFGLLIAAISGVIGFSLKH